MPSPLCELHSVRVKLHLEAQLSCSAPQRGWSTRGSHSGRCLKDVRADQSFPKQNCSAACHRLVEENAACLESCTPHCSQQTWWLVCNVGRAPSKIRSMLHGGRSLKLCRVEDVDFKFQQQVSEGCKLAHRSLLLLRCGQATTREDGVPLLDLTAASHSNSIFSVLRRYMISVSYDPLGTETTWQGNSQKDSRATQMTKRTFDAPG